jgi:hypothetical protein
MSARTVSPRIVCFLAIPLALFLYLPLLRLEDALVRRLDFLPLLLYLVSYYFLVPGALWCLGIRMRGRSVERLRAADRGKGGHAAIDLPLRIRQSQWLMWYLSAMVCFVGLIFLYLEVPPPPDRLRFPAQMLGASLLIVGLLLTLVRSPVVCEINEKGIRAPERSFFKTFMPWAETTHCEIVHDDRNFMCDYFVLTDRSGRRRFRESGAWLGQVGASDREMILRALRFRFRRQEKAGPGHRSRRRPGRRHPPCGIGRSMADSPRHRRAADLPGRLDAP